MNLLTMEHVTKAYTDRVLLDDVAFGINENEKIGVIGINGMGKSTLLKIVAGVEEYDSGKLSMGNTVKICYLPQTPVFGEEETVLQAAVRGIISDTDQWTMEAEAKSMLNQLGFSDYEEKMSHMSGGQKKRVALVMADTYRIAAVDQLKTYANILSVPLKVVYSPTELGEYLSELRDYDYCLIDTAGRSHKNEEQLKDLGNLLDQVPIADRQVYLVLNAGTKYSDLKEIAKVYSRITDFSIIFTKLDETSSAGSILNVRVETKCPLSYVTWGQNVPDDIGEIDAQKIAKQLLGGKE